MKLGILKSSTDIIEAIGQFSQESWLFMCWKSVLGRYGSINMIIKNIKYSICLLMVFGMMVLNNITAWAAPRVQPTDDTIVIVIDPGHGGKNLGTTQNGFEEKIMTLITAKAMYEELCKYDNVEVYLTRTEDVDMDLKTRAQFAQSVNADFLFSIHYNASENHDFFGSEVWVSCEPQFNCYGYQFGCVQMQTMQDKGLFLRGVKTRINDKGTDYYGILRESAELDIPAVIIEHCHVDESRDAPFCATRGDQAEFGKADALSVAKYFGLKSSVLNVDYSDYSANELVEVPSRGRVEQTLLDNSIPDVCQITLTDTNSEANEVTFEVSAADYDGMLLYYDYSIDGGKTYSPRQPWPGCNIFDGTYTDTFSITLQIPSDKKPKVVFRAYNKTDLCRQSNTVSFTESFSNENQEEAIPANGKIISEVVDSSRDGALENDTNKTSEKDLETETLLGGATGSASGTTILTPETIAEGSLMGDSAVEKPVSILDFLKICLIVVIILFAIVIFSQVLADYMHGKRLRRRRRNTYHNIYIESLSEDIQLKNEAGEISRHSR